ncbi:MAG: FAD synthetase family protein [Christensenellales bacterium]|nr:FAD synthetase family protein [Christensenellales bacterium]
MKVISCAEEFSGQSSVVALGMFDGVHIGHQALIRRAVTLAEELDSACIVCTFDRHPMSLLRPEAAPKPLLTMEENLSRFERLGVHTALVQTFTQEFARMDAEAYLRRLTAQLRARALVIGENHSFGYCGRGNADMVVSMAAELGCRAEVIRSVRDEGGVVSSTRIRRLLEQGETELASGLMEMKRS